MGGGTKMSQAFLMDERERQNLANSPHYANVQSLPELWTIAAQKFSKTIALIAPHAKPEVQVTYAQLHAQMQQFAKGLQALGVTQAAGDEHPPRVALFSDNGPRWPVADQGIMIAGGANAVRGSQADVTELAFILQNSGPIGAIVEDLATFEKLRPHLEGLTFVILLNEETAPPDQTLKVLAFPEVLALGEGRELSKPQQTRETLATLMYTSGTGGQPKGVMLTHGNMIHQAIGAAGVLQLQPGEGVMSILPIWHAYERAFETFIFSRGCTQIYTNIRYVKQDLKKYQPLYMVAVPRLWESIYEGIQKQFRDQPESKQKLVKFLLGRSESYIKAQRITQGLSLETPNPTTAEKAKAQAKTLLLAPIHKLGGKLVYQKIREGLGTKLDVVVSGGGSIADHLEDFFEIIGITILSGYGLTETAPITNVRRPWRNIRGADGQPLLDTEIRIVDLETRQPLGFNKQGLILIRGPQVMQGYFRNPDATAKVLDGDGWFDSGDLGILLPDHNLIITGRSKDTIVLSNGENIDPQPIEDHLLSCDLISQIMLIGQDQKVLGALIVPNLEALEKRLGQNPDLGSEAVQSLYRKELGDRVKTRPGYRADERIGVFSLIAEPFSVENGLLTQTLKVKRNVVAERYKEMIEGLFR